MEWITFAERILASPSGETLLVTFSGESSIPPAGSTAPWRVSVEDSELDETRHYSTRDFSSALNYFATVGAMSFAVIEEDLSGLSTPDQRRLGRLTIDNP